MKSFTDKNGESWDLDLNIGAAMRLKSRLDIDIENAVTIDKANNPEDVSLLERIAQDSILLFNIIFVLCETQVRERNLTPEQFAERFTGDTIEAATDALLDEIVNFSRPAKRKVLIRLRQISKEYSERANQQLDQVLADPKFQNEIEKHLQKSLTSSQESSE